MSCTAIISLSLALTLSAVAPSRAEAPSRELLSRALAPEKLGLRAGEARLVMQLRDAAGRIVERSLRVRTATGDGWRKMRLTFLEPIDQAGVELLVVEQRGAAAEQTMWLPRARELRRIAPGDRQAGLQGSDFTFEDFERRELGGATVVVAGDEVIGGVACTRLVATELPGRFSKVTFWVAKETEIPLRIEFLQGVAASEKLARRFEVKRLQKVDGVLTPTRLVMSDELAGTRTTLDLSDFHDARLPESLFTPDALGR